MTRLSRRAILTATAVTVVVTAGCLGEGSGSYDGEDSADQAANATTDPDDSTATNLDESAIAETALPIADTSLPLEYSLESLRDEAVNGGVPKNGIPSIDSPSFESADDVGDRLDDGDPVFGVVIDGDARAYPQSILVYHEIVNDEVGGEPVAVTYCPLTGTAMGFSRGDVEFGVSGDLVNSNLIMYDREGDSRWPQMLGTAIAGPLAGASLEEVPVHWSTWGRWREAYPDSRVLTDETGYVRDYGRDPYGSYNPPEGYYAEDSPTMFQSLSTDDRHPNKRMVLGARPPAGPIAIDIERLADEGLLPVGVETTGDGDDAAADDPADDHEEDTTSETSDVAESSSLAVYDQRIDAGRLYLGDGTDYSYDHDEGTVVNDAEGTQFEADELPLESVYAFDAMWFAWVGFYPSTAVVD
ncbi:DUF3179 domain-containing protein [Natronosalvus vescus]|uniref:DUF3179 domain-containing protein n=1 Tax=Natronosalvus vescus TaxID=2953881 RepID=UPI0020903A8D|nr:DUF3179 domain-containing protein [Natronosalvus vescus]